jgi:hypothetical protein
LLAEQLSIAPLFH